MTDTVETPVVVDEFAESFAKFSEPELPVLTPTATVAEVPVVEDVAPPVVESDGTETPVEEPVEEPTKEPPAKHDTALLSKLEELLDKQAKAAEPPPVEQPPVQQQTPAPQADPYSPEERTFLDEYEREWGDVSKAEALKRRAEYNNLIQYVFNEVADVLRPMTQDLQQIVRDRQSAQLLGAVPEFGTLQESLTAWTDSQPAYLREAYQRVIQGGKPDEIADLVDRYKKDTQGSVVNSSKQTVTELPPPAKKAAQALAPVSSKRSSVVATEPDKNDFDSAFAKFATTT